MNTWYFLSLRHSLFMQLSLTNLTSVQHHFVNLISKLDHPTPLSILFSGLLHGHGVGSWPGIVH
jgi:hypothetical protein